MPIIDLKIPASIVKRLKLPGNDPRKAQLRTLKRYLRKAKNTQFGQDHGFDRLLMSRHVGKQFQKQVPIFDYNKIFDQYWKRALDGMSDVTWPGQIKYFALSSGTSEASSKYIPITRELIKSNTVTSFRQLMSLTGYQHVNFSALPKGWLMLGGSINLQKGPTYYAGDLSGIQQRHIPIWFQRLYKPGKKIARERDWSKKLDEIVENAPNWDIGFALGVPAWLQLCIEKIIERYQLKSIHDIWPNFSFYVYGGVALEPYKKAFDKLLGKPITYIETYLASEGFLAYQSRQHAKGMRLSVHSIFFEFIPFDDKNFDTEGNVKPEAQALMLHEVEANKDYAILISTNAGAWRYLIGDTVRFVDLQHLEIIITGRTKHFLSLVGEHLSVDNMNRAIQLVSEELNVSIPEYAVTGEPYGTFFAHHWYVACNQPVDAEELRHRIDKTLCELNDDYEVERRHALKELKVTVLPESVFMNFMKSKGKVGGQHKFPRVLKGQYLEEWKEYLIKQLPTLLTASGKMEQAPL